MATAITAVIVSLFVAAALFALIRQRKRSCRTNCQNCSKSVGCPGCASVTADWIAENGTNRT